MMIRNKHFLQRHEMRVNEATQQLHRLLWNKHPQRHISFCEVTCGASYHLWSQKAELWLNSLLFLASELSDYNSPQIQDTKRQEPSETAMAEMVQEEKQ